MLTPGQQVTLDIEKPAAGGRMIARYEGQVVFVLGAIPGERVTVRIDKVDRQLAFGTTVGVVTVSPDRREPFVDPLCGGCLYAHITYPAQLRVKTGIVVDAFGRLGRITLPAFDVAPSPDRGYRMRGRLFVQGADAGFYREGTHTLCDAAGTGQLTGEAVGIAVSAAATLHARGTDVLSVTISENIAGDQRALHAELRPGARADDLVLQEIVREHGLRGLSTRAGMVLRAAGEPVVADPLHVLASQASAQGALSRHAESFFQANRYLLPSLVAAVLEAVPGPGDVLELYAGVGLFSVGLAATGRTRITAVEGDLASGADLRKNASQFAGALKVVLGSVEDHAATVGRTPATVIVDPPRTGISKAAMQRVLALGASRVVYVSCDPPTMARDARRLLDAGYALDALRAFDLFPNTPHVECLGVFTRDAVSG